MLGKFLRSIRKSKGLSQHQVAINIGIHRNRVIEVEKSDKNYFSDRLIVYADGLGFDIEIHFIDKQDKRNVIVYKK